uniref:Zinc finger domain containing protein n=1 Tax=Haemonchus contortus TaxID=6289 RepID=W6NKT4_HAECO
MEARGEENGQEASELGVPIPEGGQFKCDVSGCEYITRSGTDLETHKSRMHIAANKKGRRLTECPICQLRLTNQEDLVNHCRLHHDDEACVVEERSFDNDMEFEAWKEATEKKFLTFWHLSGRKQKGRDDVVYYKCSRSGLRRLRGKGKVAPHIKVVTPFCTSFLQKYIARSGGILVKFCTKHIGHDLDAISLPLSKSDKNLIAQYLEQGLPSKTIRKKIREKYTDPSVKLHWISSSDIKNVMASINLQRRKLKNMGVSTAEAGSSINGVQQTDTEHNFDDSSISAASLLEDSSMSIAHDEESGDEGSVRGDAQNGDLASKAPIPVETLLSCSSFVELNEKVAQLGSTLEKINERLLNLEDSKLFHNAIKEEEKEL